MTASWNAAERGQRAFFTALVVHARRARRGTTRARPCRSSTADHAADRRLRGEPGGIAALVRTSPRHVVRSATSSARRAARRGARFLAVTPASRVWQSSSRARPFPKTRQHGHVDPRKVKPMRAPRAAVRAPRAGSRASRLESRRKPQPGRPAARASRFHISHLRFTGLAKRTEPRGSTSPAPKRHDALTTHF